ncbi:MAG: NAD(P)-binding domain-containing protein, partial [Gammaproteobacteria bacterium]|nr:NAD(P)-binding domain-containing protein [Gammaproteobacteria bacterium]
RDSVTELVARTGNGASVTTPAASVQNADIVVLAVPGALAVDIAKSLGDLAGKIVIDPTNNYVREGVPRLATDTSNGEALQAALPGAKVVKAFNTLNWRQMVDPDSSGGPVSIPLVGDDIEAKTRVAELVAGMGLEPVDVGPIANARHVEGMLVLWAHARVSGQPFNYHLRRMPAN